MDRVLAYHLHLIGRELPRQVIANYPDPSVDRNSHPKNLTGKAENAFALRVNLLFAQNVAVVLETTIRNAGLEK